MNITNIIELSKCADQICTTLSMNNINVPRIDHFKDIFTWLNEYELATATLPEECRFKMLVKAFPPGRYQSWFEKTLQPSIRMNVSWKAIKSIIIQRYSDTEDRDRHFRRLQEMKFVDSGQEKLFDYVEDLIFTLGIVFPDQKDDDTKIRYIKSQLPASIQPRLRQIAEFNNAKDLEEFMKGVRQYDKLKFGCQETTNDKEAKVTGVELVSLLKELVKGVKQEGEATRNVVAALRPRSPSPKPRSTNVALPNLSYGYNHEASPHHSQHINHINRLRPISPFNPSSNQRGYSPARQSVERERPHHNEPNRYYPRRRSPSPYNNGQASYNRNRSSDRDERDDHHDRRAPSPPIQSRYQDHMKAQSSSHADHQASSYNHQQPSESQVKTAFNDEAYYEKFGMPKTPCQHCDLWHWSRHCVKNLN